jgi:hypothetical protein
MWVGLLLLLLPAASSTSGLPPVAEDDRRSPSPVAKSINQNSGQREQREVSVERPKVQQPAFQNLRFEEDWGVLSNSSRDSTYEKFKYIPLNAEGTSFFSFFSFGGQVRIRGELWRNFAFGGGGNRNDGFALLRVRLHSDLWISPRVRVFVEGKSSLSTDRGLPGGRRRLDVDTADLQNLMVDINLSLEPAVSKVRLGRQELQFGKQRLVSPLDWSNTRRTWDAARVSLKGGNWRADGFWSKFVQIHKYSLNGSCDSGIDFYGVYATHTRPSSNYDFYWLGFERRRSIWSGIAGEENRQTFGGRFGGAFAEGQGSYDLEAAFQFGRVAESDVAASMFGSQLGYQFEGGVISPRIYSGLDFGSGDKDDSDNSIGTFNQLFPLGHAYLGFIDLVGRQNIVDWSAGTSIRLARRLVIRLDLHNFWRASTNDALYNAGGGIVRPGNAGESNFVGNELDLTASTTVNRHWTLSGGYCHFFAGRFIEESGSAEGIDFLYVQLQATF